MMLSRVKGHGFARLCKLSQRDDARGTAIQVFFLQRTGGNRALKKRTIMLQIIDEIGDITTPKGKDESRAQLSAACIRWSQAQRDHAEVAEAHRALELAQQGNVVRFPGTAVASSSSDATTSAPAHETDEEPWPDYRGMV